MQNLTEYLSCICNHGSFVIKCFDNFVLPLLRLFLHIIKNKLLKLNKTKQNRGHDKNKTKQNRLLGRVLVRSTPVDNTISKVLVIIKIRICMKGCSSWASSHSQLLYSINIHEAVPGESNSYSLMISISKKGLEWIFLFSLKKIFWIDLQCVSFSCRARWFSYTYTRIYSFLGSGFLICT